MNSVDTAPPTFWVGESGVLQLGELLLERLQPPQPLVEVGVVEGRVVEDVVAPACVLDLLGQPSVLLAGLRSGRLGVDHGVILPVASDTPPARARSLVQTGTVIRLGWNDLRWHAVLDETKPFRFIHVNTQEPRR